MNRVFKNELRKGGYMNIITAYTDFSFLNIEEHLNRMISCFGHLVSDPMSGWMQYQHSDKAEKEYMRVMEAARSIRAHSDTFIVIGIGGSYLGAKAVIDALSPSLCDSCEKGIRIVYAGQTLSGDYLAEVLRLIRSTRVSVNIVSKSGSTVETDIAARIVVDEMRRVYGEHLRERVFITTDEKMGALRKYADEMGFVSFGIPEDIGGRFSVFTPVGLLPMAVAGVDCDAFVRGIKAGISKYGKSDRQNQALRYAAMRNCLDEGGKDVELLAVYEPRHVGIAAWWVQLFGESCGKDGKGLFPAFASYTTDLHSIGQLVQEGRRNLFETVLWCPSESDYEIPALPKVQLRYRGEDSLAGKTLSEVSRASYIGTMRAHYEGGVPCIGIELGQNSAEEIGELLYFFMIAVSLSALAQGLNPFDQPGVEAYKKSMKEVLSRSSRTEAHTT